MNLLRKIKTVCIVPLFALLVSCASVQTQCGCTKSLTIVPPTSSFVKIVLYNGRLPVSTGSGVIIDHVNETNTIIATAKHICEKNDGTERDQIKIFDIHTAQYQGLVLSRTPNHDLCLITTKTKIDFPAVKLAEIGPKAGESSFNLAAPYGIHDDGMILIFHGHYSGKMHIPVEDQPLDVYTIPGGGGSSGSPVFNENWELVGIISRGHAYLEHVMLSVGFEHVHQALATIKPELPRLAALRVVRDVLDNINPKPPPLPEKKSLPTPKPLTPQ